MPKFRKKPVIIEAHRWTEPRKWAENYPCKDPRPEFNKSVTWVDSGHAEVYTIHAGQSVRIEHGDYIIPEPDGIHYYPCKPDIFNASYERVY